MEIFARAREIEPALRALGVTRLALFGSFLNGVPGPQSDVDLLIDFAPGTKSYDAFSRAVMMLEESLGRRVELITFQSLSPYIGPRILRSVEDVIPAA
jgi:predicted nucleotidyltransferase